MTSAGSVITFFGFLFKMERHSLSLRDGEHCGCKLWAAGSHFSSDGGEDEARVPRHSEPRGLGKAKKMST